MIPSWFCRTRRRLGRCGCRRARHASAGDGGYSEKKLWIEIFYFSKISKSLTSFSSWLRPEAPNVLDCASRLQGAGPGQVAWLRKKSVGLRFSLEEEPQIALGLWGVEPKNWTFKCKRKSNLKSTFVANNFKKGIFFKMKSRINFKMSIPPPYSG